MADNFITNTAQDLYGLGSSGKKTDKNLGDKGSVKIYSFSTNQTISFSNVFNINYSDTYQLSWTSNEVYGRMDPIATYKNTKRKMNLSFELVGDGDVTRTNKMQLNILKNSLYPVYTNDLKGTAIISSPPMFRVKWNSIVFNPKTEEQEILGETLRGGLLCYLDNFEIKPAVLNGGGWMMEDGVLTAKNFNINLGLNIIHEYPLGNSFVGKTSTPRVILSKVARNVTNNLSPLPQNSSTESAASVTSEATATSPTSPTNSLEELRAQASTAVSTAGQNVQQTSQERYANAKATDLSSDFVNQVESGDSNQAAINKELKNFLLNGDDGTIKSIMNNKNKSKWQKTISQLKKMAQGDDKYKGVNL